MSGLSRAKDPKERCAPRMVCVKTEEGLQPLYTTSRTGLGWGTTKWPPGEGLLPVDLVRKMTRQLILSTPHCCEERTVELQPRSRGYGVSVPAPETHFKPTATARPGLERGATPSLNQTTFRRHDRGAPRRVGLGRAAFGAPALAPRPREAEFKARDPDTGVVPRGLSGVRSKAGSLRWSDVRDNVRGPVGAGRR